MKVVVTGASTYGVDNMGDDAMLSCLIRGIRQADGDASITFLARHPCVDFDRTFGVTSVQNLDHRSNDAAKGRFFMGFNKDDSRDNLKNIHEALSNADLLVIGGNSLMEISDNTFLRGVSSYATTLATFSIFLGKPYALFGLNIVGHIRNPFVIQQAKFLVEKSAVSTVREIHAFNYLSEVGVDTSSVRITGDPAYGVDLKRVEDYDGWELLRGIGVCLEPTLRTITICVREEYWKTSDVTTMNLEKEVCTLLDHILQNSINQVLFIPNCYYQHGHPLEDDRQVNRGIRARFGDHKRVHYVESTLNLYQTLSIFKLTHVHISNRRHSNIFAAIFGKPFIPINTSLKSHISSFVEDLGQSNFLVSSSSFSRKVAENLDFILINYDEVSQRLSSIVSNHIDNGLTSVNLITDLFRE
ncbi:MAG: polysaccharide pyruvyl transferase family protein [Leptolyngbyaceae bacterium]|nr:polysaccharide pyruvyl transferase family protein [Leptolyngbyaceae bacterium]